MTRRLFVAAWPVASARAEAEAALGALRESGDPVRWVRPENLHFTLQFLGDVEAARVPELTELLAASLVGVAPFRLRLSGLGRFPERGAPRVIWIGADEGRRELAALASRIERPLERGGFLTPEDRPFRAHLTLGRVRGSRGLRELEERLAVTTVRGEPWTVDEIRLVESRLERHGAQYEPVARFPLPETLPE